MVCNFFKVNNFKKNWVSHTECTWCCCVQLFSSVVLEQLVAGESFITITGDTNFLAELVDDGWCVTTATQTLNCVQTWVIPASHKFIIDESFDLTLTQYSVGHVETAELPNHWLVHLTLLQEPVVAFATNFELKSTQGVSNVLHRVYHTMSEIISWVDAPLVT